MDIEQTEKSINDPAIKEEMDRIFSFPVYSPIVCHPNIVKSPEGEWVFLFAFGVRMDADSDLEQYINIALPIEVVEQMLPNMEEQIKRFHEGGGQKSRTN